MSAAMQDIERHFTAAELAGLPAMPETVSGVIRAAKRHQWTGRDRKGRGGGIEYALSSLPSDTQRELRRRASISAASAAFRAGQTEGRREALTAHVGDTLTWHARQQGAAKLAALTGKARERANARLDILLAFETFVRASGFSVSAALEPFCSSLARREIDMPEATLAVVGERVSAPTLRRWRDALRKEGAAALAGDYGNRDGAGALDADPDLHALATAMLVEHPHAKSSAVLRALSARFRTRKLPNLRTVQRFIARWRDENQQVLLAISNPDAWKNKHMLAFGNASEDVTRLNQRWEFDSSPADILLEDGRYTLIAIIDVWSRRAIIQVAKTSSSAAVCCALRRAVLAWGVLEVAKVDNGQDYVSNHLTRALTGLGTEVRVSAPFSPWEKPHVERFFHTFSHDLVELLPGYAGHNVAEAQAIRSRDSFADRLFKKGGEVQLKMTAADLQSICDRWCSDIYEHEPRKGLGGMSVFERVASWRGEVRRVSDPRVLDMLLAEAPDGNGGRTVGKKGIRVDGFTYVAPDLGSLVGERVRVLYDTADMGRLVVYHDEAFVCIAECPEILGLSRKDLAQEAKSRQKHDIALKKRELKAAARKQSTADIAREILDSRQEDASRLASMPAKNILHLTPAIEAAREAAEAVDAPAAAPSLPSLTVADVREVHGRLRSEQQQDETSETRFLRTIDVLMKPVDERNDIERGWLRSQLDTSEFRARWMCFENFGPEGMGLDSSYAALLPDGAFYHRYVKAKKGEI